MSRINNKGFMMAEVIIVSTIVLAFLTTIYVSYNKVFAAYKKRISYYDTVTFYELAYYKSASMTTPLDTSNENLISIDDIKTYENNDTTTSQNFKDYITFLQNDLSGDDHSKIMALEKCSTVDKTCKYAYIDNN